MKKLNNFSKHTWINRKIFLGTIFLGILIIGALLYNYFSVQTSQQKATAFIWNKKGDKIYYLSPQTNIVELRSFASSLFYFQEETLIPTSKNSNPTAFFSTSGDFALILEKVKNTDHSWLKTLSFSDNSLSYLNSKEAQSYFSPSPDNTLLIYPTHKAQNNRDYYNLNLYSLEKNYLIEEKILPSYVSNIDEISWTADNQKVLFSVYPSTFDFTKNLYLFDLKTRQLRELLSFQDGYTKFYANDQNVVYVSETKIGLYNIETETRKEISDLEITPYDIFCTWKTKTSFVCQISDSATQKRTFWEIKTDSLEKTKVLEIPIQEYQKTNLYFACAPNKKKLAYFDEKGKIVVRSFRITPWF